MTIETNAEARRARAAELVAEIRTHSGAYVAALEDLTVAIETHLGRLHAARLAWNEAHHEGMRLAQIHAQGAGGLTGPAALADLAGGPEDAETLRTSLHPYTQLAQRWTLPPALYTDRPALTRAALAVEVATQLADRVMSLPTKEGSQ